MLLTLTRPHTSSLEVVPDVPPKETPQQLSYCSLPSSFSTSDESSLSHSSCDTGSEAVICSLATRPPTPTPPRPSRHAARSHDRRPKTAPPSAIGTSLSRGPFSVEESDGGGQPVVVSVDLFCAKFTSVADQSDFMRGNQLFDAKFRMPVAGVIVFFLFTRTTTTYGRCSDAGE